MSQVVLKIGLSETQRNSLLALAEALASCAVAFAEPFTIGEDAEEPAAETPLIVFDNGTIRVTRDGYISVLPHDFLAGVLKVHYEGADLGQFEPGKWVIYCYDEELKGGKQKWRTVKQGEKYLPLGIYIAGIVEVPSR